MRFSAVVVTAFVASATGAAAFSQRSPGKFYPKIGRQLERIFDAEQECASNSKLTNFSLVLLSAAFVSTRVGTAPAVSVVATSISHPKGCFCSACTGHAAICRCSSCALGKTALFMADVVETETEAVAAADAEIPVEVAALDGVLSEDEAHNADRPARKSLKKKSPSDDENKTPITDLKIGDAIAGAKVKTITNYGAFLDIGAATDGLLHISQLSVDFVANVNDVLKEGQLVDVRIINIDEAKNQVGLTLLTADEQDKAAASQSSARPPRQDRSAGGGGGGQARRDDGAVLTSLQQKGWNPEQFVPGTVVSTVDFGAFVRVDASELNSECTGDFDGLVHISALSTGRVDSVSSICKVNDKVQVRVRGIENKKVSLTMVSVEDEATKGANRGGSGGGQSEPVGNKEWREAVSSLTDDMPKFFNGPAVVDLRK
jgi:predicted RNA-binding protein with RPS1 domain